jgi:hypothetical protein
MRITRARAISLAVAVLMSQSCPHGRAQAALLLLDADGAAALLSPTGHEAVYFARICAAGASHLRRCRPGELGVVISRYRGIGSYDWLAMPLIPYLYSVENAAQVPSRVNRESVQSLRLAYHDAHLMSLGNAQEGGGVHRGWNQLVGAAYERRIWVFRFATSEEQDDAFIRRMNADANHSHFNIFFSNCSNFTSSVLDFYFPHTFKRRILPDLGMVTPRQVAYELVRFAQKHAGVHLSVMEIPLVPGIHRSSRVGKGADASLIASGYVIPIAILSPYAAGAILADDLIWGREPLPLKNALVLSPQELAALKSPSNQIIAQESTQPGNAPSNVTLAGPAWPER